MPALIFTVAQALAAYADDPTIAPVAILDSAAAVNASLDAIEAMAEAVSSIALTDPSPALTISFTQYASDATILKLINGTVALTVTGVPAWAPVVLQSDAKVTAFSVSSSSANVAQNLDTLQGTTKLRAIVLTDTDPLAITYAELVADTGALAALPSNYTLIVSGVPAAAAAAVQANTHVTGFSVSDGSSNVSANLDALNAVTKIAAITLADSNALSITQAQLAADSTALGKLPGSYTASVRGASVASAASLQANAHVTAFAVSDSAANVAGGLDTLSGYAKLSSIALTGGGTPNVSITYAQYQSDGAAIGAITGNYGLVVSLVPASAVASVQADIKVTAFSVTGVTVAAAGSVQTLSKVSSFAVLDSASSVAGGLDGLAADTKLGAIALTDAGTPSLPVTYTQYSADQATLGLISSAHTLAVSAVPASAAATLQADSGVGSFTVIGAPVSGAAALQADSKVVSFAVSDSAAAVSGGLDALAGYARLSSIGLTGANSVLTISYGQLTNDSVALGKISGAFGLAITAVSAANAQAVQANAQVTGFAVADTAAAISSAFDALQAASKLTAIGLTDSNALAISYQQLTNDTTALGLLPNTYSLIVSGVPASAVASVQANSHVVSFSVSDSSAAVSAAFDTLNATTKLTSISLTDAGAIATTAAQLGADTSVLGKLPNGASLAVSGVSVASAGLIQANTHVTGFAVADSASAVTAGLNALAGFGKLTSIGLTDGGTPVLSLSYTQYAADTAALAAISGSFALVISGAPASAAAALHADAHVTRFAVLDTASNLLANLAALAAANTVGLTGQSNTVTAPQYAQLIGLPNFAITSGASMTAAAATGSGVATIASNGTLAVTGSIAATETVTFAGANAELILGTPGVGFAGSLTGLNTGDRIEFGGGLSVASATMLNAHTIAVGVGAGFYDLTNVNLANGAPTGWVVGTDTATGNSYIQLEPARTLTWTGAADTNLANPLDYSDTTLGQTPAQWAPDATDTILFGVNSLITGHATAAALSFGGGSALNLTTGATLAASTITVGSTQLDNLLIDNGSLLIDSGSAVIAATTGADGSFADVVGTGSGWQIGGNLDVGYAATGFLSVGTGATVTAANLRAGVLATGGGIITVSGPNAELDLTGNLSIGGAGAGNLSVLNGGILNIGGDLNIGTVAGGSGNVNFADTTGTIYIGNNLNVGGFGAPAVLVIGLNTTVIFDNGSENILAGGNVILGTPFDPPPILNVSPGGSQTFATGVNAYPQYITNSGQLSVSANGSVTIETPYITENTAGTLGSWNIGSGATLVLDADTVTAQTFNFGGPGTLVIGLDVLTSVKQLNGSGTVVSVTNPNLGTALIGNFGGTIAGFSTGDTIDVYTYGTATFNQSGSVVSVMQNGTTTGTLAFASTIMAASALSSIIDVPQALCFLAGTLIDTPDGEVHVETLAVGDKVRTASGQVRPIVWIGQGKVLATRGRRNAATPVIVRKGALGRNVPHWDLRVTKGHSVYIDDVLIPVEFLVNHRSILWDDQAQEVSIFHVELETHDVLLANGAPAESYRDDGNRWLFQNANSGWDQPAKPPCAPVLTGGAVVDAVWRRLLTLCGPRPGLPLTQDADLHLEVDGVRVDGAQSEGRAVFRVPADARMVRVMSRAASPQELGLSRDPRILGVALRGVEVWQGRRVSVLAASDAGLTDGFHSYEADCDHRWTDGNAALPGAVFAGFSGMVDVVLLTDGTTWYHDDGAAAGVAVAA